MVLLSGGAAGRLLVTVAPISTTSASVEPQHGGSTHFDSVHVASGMVLKGNTIVELLTRRNGLVAVTLLAAGLLAFSLRNRPYGPAEGASDVFHALLDKDSSPPPERITVINGSEGNLTASQVKQLFQTVLRPPLANYSIISMDAEMVSEDSGGAYAMVTGPSGTSKWLLTGWPSPTGPVFTLDSLLRKAWTADVPSSGGHDPEWSEMRRSLLKGLRRDRAALESMDIRSLDFGKQGQITWDQLDAWLSESR